MSICNLFKLKLVIDTAKNVLYTERRKGVIKVFNTKMLEHLLIEKGWDQRDLANAADVSEPTITRMKRGETFNSETLGKLARALGCNPIDLLDTKGYPAPHLVAPTFAGTFAFQR